MGYMHIDNLYKNQEILLFRKCFALEKVHGTSAHISWRGQEPKFFAGGESHERFVKLFDATTLTEGFQAMGHPEVTVYGEAYGGKQQGMRLTYGEELRFIVFDVKVGPHWLSVPQMDSAAAALGLEVVPWGEFSTDIEVLDELRDAPSQVAFRRGCGTDKAREGIVLRPPIEVTKNNGERIIAKHKGEKFSERATPQKVVDPAKLEVLSAAQAIADEWVTEMRLTHVLDKMPGASMEQTPKVISAMVEDVVREGAGEIVDTKEARAAIGRRTAQLFKARLKNALRSAAGEL